MYGRGGWVTMTIRKSRTRSSGARLGLKLTLVVPVVILIALALPIVFASPELNEIAWRKDLAVYREQMPLRHGNLFHTLSSARFYSSIDDFEHALRRLTPSQSKVELLRLVAMINDGHTRVRPETLGNHMLPVRVRFFADGLYVEAAASEFASLVGGRVSRIGSLPEDEVYARVRPLVSVDDDNEHRRRLLAADLLITPEVLVGVGACADAGTVTFTVEHDGKEQVARLPAGPFRIGSNHGWPVNPPGWVDARRSARVPAPLWLRNTRQNYWHEFLPDGQTLYVQYNNVEDQPGGETIEHYFPRVFMEAATRHVSRLVIDLRLNGGGNNELNRPIWHALLRSPQLNQKGRLWVLIGPQTFSAAMNFVDDLELNTNALFAGEPTGETPNMWGDPVGITLPNTRIVIQASTLWWQFADPRDHRPFRAPDLLVPLTFADYSRNIDPVLGAILKRPALAHY
jgi:hypothetical protein